MVASTASAVNKARRFFVRTEKAVQYRVPEDAQSALEFADRSIEQYDRSILPEAEAALEAAEVAYKVGQIDFNALLTAQTDLLDIRLERLDLLRRYHQTRAALTELYGAPDER